MSVKKKRSILNVYFSIYVKIEVAVGPRDKAYVLNLQYVQYKIYNLF